MCIALKKGHSVSCTFVPGHDTNHCQTREITVDRRDGGTKLLSSGRGNRDRVFWVILAVLTPEPLLPPDNVQDFPETSKSSDDLRHPEGEDFML